MNAPSPDQPSPAIDHERHHNCNSRLRLFSELAADNSHAPMFSRFNRLAAMCLLHRQHEILQLEQRIRQNLDSHSNREDPLNILTPLLLEYCAAIPRPSPERPISVLTLLLVLDQFIYVMSQTPRHHTSQLGQRRRHTQGLMADSLVRFLRSG